MQSRQFGADTDQQKQCSAGYCGAVQGGQGGAGSLVCIEGQRMESGALSQHRAGRCSRQWRACRDVLPHAVTSPCTRGSLPVQATLVRSDCSQSPNEFAAVQDCIGLAACDVAPDADWGSVGGGGCTARLETEYRQVQASTHLATAGPVALAGHAHGRLKGSVCVRWVALTFC